MCSYKSVKSSATLRIKAIQSLHEGQKTVLKSILKLLIRHLKLAHHRQHQGLKSYDKHFSRHLCVFPLWAVSRMFLPIFIGFYQRVNLFVLIHSPLLFILIKVRHTQNNLRVPVLHSLAVLAK